MFHCGFSYTEAYNLPIQYKRWFIERVSKELAPPEKSDGNNQMPSNFPKTPSGRSAQRQASKF